MGKYAVINRRDFIPGSSPGTIMSTHPTLGEADKESAKWREGYVMVVELLRKPEGRHIHSGEYRLIPRQLKPGEEKKYGISVNFQHGYDLMTKKQIIEYADKNGFVPHIYSGNNYSLIAYNKVTERTWGDLEKDPYMETIYLLGETPKPEYSNS